MAKSEPELRFSDFICISLTLTRLSLKVYYVSGDVLGVQGAKMGDCCHWPWVSSFVGNWVCGKTIRLRYDICNNGIVHKLPCEPRNLVTWPWLNCPDRSLQLDQKQPSSDLPGTLGRPDIVILPENGHNLLTQPMTCRWQFWLWKSQKITAPE